MDDFTVTCAHGFYSTKTTRRLRSILASALIYILFALIFFSWIQLLYVHHWASVTKKEKLAGCPFQRERETEGDMETQRRGRVFWMWRGGC